MALVAAIGKNGSKPKSGAECEVLGAEWSLSSGKLTCYLLLATCRSPFAIRYSPIATVLARQETRPPIFLVHRPILSRRSISASSTTDWSP